ncbi:lantibiotic dehydratase C-terminal domain-containing protein [Microbispora sp. CA-135349]|uniref:lantibiotic dehydratase C-terminal domain-containing protein n=1 Tax=Microbispora sp. CA-135349 TaxID=3239953 RepID=UPI003D8C66B4
MTGSDTPGEWQAIHIFYSSDPSPLLSGCVAPLVRRLRADGLISRYFFINYWLEGPHVRLRLKPVSAAATAETLRIAEEAVDEFLRSRPALYEVDSEYMLNFYDELFRLEYSDEERIAKYGEGGSMPLRPNNSRFRIPYEPEYDKYGGMAGVELAEWHFEKSSDLVLELLTTTNMHVRTVMLGLATQLMMIMSMSLLREPKEVAAFMERYHLFWHEWFNLGDSDRETRYAANHDRLAEDLRHRFSEICLAVGSGRLDRLTPLSRGWASHCAELRTRVTTLAESGLLVFPKRDDRGQFPVHGGATEREPVRDPEVALRILLSPYLHMTNNRLGTNVVDESYLSFLLARTLREEPFAALLAWTAP